MFAFYEPALQEGVNYLNEEESEHCLKVLRLKTGDPILVLDGKGAVDECEIVSVTSGKVSFRSISINRIKPRAFTTHLGISPVKSHEKIEWCVEKCTEIGVDKITFVVTSHSERNKIRLDRLEKKAISALKQSRNPFLPELADITTLSDFVSATKAQQKFICHAGSAKPLFHSAERNENYCILVGPEGDFTKEELIMAEGAGFRKVSLGKNILRTETAGLYSVAILYVLNS